MASIQPKTVHGKKYWQIVQSQRINGKPRPIVIEHLGTADSLLKKLRGREGALKVKSYSHGLVSILLEISRTLNLVSIINKYVQSRRKYFADKPVCNNLTVGVTLLLAAIGRICLPTSKRGWYAWAKKTSLSFMTRKSFVKIDSQHFWDMMDSFPAENIEQAEMEIIRNIKRQYNVETDNLFYDTTNFYTYIATTNKRCTIARRGKNKQKRADLRQVGLAMVVSKNDFIPLFHETYRGNMNDAPVFKKMVYKLKKRMAALKMNLDSHTIVFDRGCNSKTNLKLVAGLEMFYAGALTPYHHLKLIEDADGNYEDVKVGDDVLQVYRDRREIWGEERTVLVFVSEKLKTGQLRGIYTILHRKMEALEDFSNGMGKPRTKKYTGKELTEKLNKMIKTSSQLEGIINYAVIKKRNRPYSFVYGIDNGKLEELEDSLGFRIIMTNRHDWNSADIIESYYGQSFIENAFKNIKNPFHLAVTPEFHWTDQKIKVHFFSCVLGFTLTTLIWKKAKERINYKGNLDNLLDALNDIRLAMIIENTGKKGKPKVTYQLEEMEADEEKMVKALEITDLHKKPIKIPGFSLYN